MGWEALAVGWEVSGGSPGRPGGFERSSLLARRC